MVTFYLCANPTPLLLCRRSNNLALLPRLHNCCTTDTQLLQNSYTTVTQLSLNCYMQLLHSCHTTDMQLLHNCYTPSTPQLHLRYTTIATSARYNGPRLLPLALECSINHGIDRHNTFARAFYAPGKTASNAGM